MSWHVLATSQLRPGVCYHLYCRRRRRSQDVIGGPIPLPGMFELVGGWDVSKHNMYISISSRYIPLLFQLPSSKCQTGHAGWASSARNATQGALEVFDAVAHAVSEKSHSVSLFQWTQLDSRKNKIKKLGTVVDVARICFEMSQTHHFSNFPSHIGIWPIWHRHMADFLKDTVFCLNHFETPGIPKNLLDLRKLFPQEARGPKYSYQTITSFGKLDSAWHRFQMF